MEVLFLTGLVPYPPTSGATTRTYNLIRRMARRHQLHLLTYADMQRDARSIAVLEECCTSVTTVPWRETKGRVYFYLELLGNLLSDAPVIVSRFTKPEMAKAIQSILQTEHIDLIYCDFLTLSRNLRGGNGRPKVATAHNVESELWKRYLASKIFNLVPPPILSGTTYTAPLAR